MISRAAMVAEARSCIDTPFAHQGRMKGAALDCAGLIIHVAHASGIAPEYDKRDYRRAPDPVIMRRELERHCREIAYRDLKPADIIWFRFFEEPQHLALVSETAPLLRVIHAYGKRGIMRTIEQEVTAGWRGRIHSCWRYKGVE